MYLQWTIWEGNKTIPFTIISRWIELLGVNVTKEVKDLYTENYKMLRKGIKNNLSKFY